MELKCAACTSHDVAVVVVVAAYAVAVADVVALVVACVWRYQHVAPIWSLPFLRILIMLVSPEVIWLFTFFTFRYAKDLCRLIKQRSRLLLLLRHCHCHRQRRTVVEMINTS